MNPHGTAHYGVGFGIVFQFHAGNSTSNLDSQCVEVCLRPDCRRRGGLEETSSSSRTERIVQRDANGWREANVILRSGNAPKKLASEGSRRPRESPADRSLCIFPSAPFPKVNWGPLPGEMEESAFPQQQPIFMGGKLPLKPGLLLEATDPV